MKKSTLGIIGMGNMGFAILSGILDSGKLPPCEIAVFDPAAEKLAPLAEKGVRVLQSAEEIAAGCEYILLAVKPQVMEAVLLEIKDTARRESVYISIAAGISAAFLKERLGFDCKAVLVMPNTPLLIGSGTSALARVEPTSAQEFEFVMDLFRSAGTADAIDEARMIDVIPLNGSSPAMIYLFAKQFVENAVRHGFDEDTANRLICGTLIGAAQMMLKSGKSHQELIDMVCSPGGTTLAGLKELHDAGFGEIMDKAIEATIRRGYELGK